MRETGEAGVPTPKLLCRTSMHGGAACDGLPDVCPCCARGLFRVSGYHELLQSESGPVGSGYGFDFLQFLRRYTNLNYEYVGYEDGWQDMQQMLRDGEIDLVTSAHTAQLLRMKHAFRKSRMCDVSQRRWLH